MTGVRVSKEKKKPVSVVQCASLCTEENGPPAALFPLCLRERGGERDKMTRTH